MLDFFKLFKPFRDMYMLWINCFALSITFVSVKFLNFEGRDEVIGWTTLLLSVITFASLLVILFREKKNTSKFITGTISASILGLGSLQFSLSIWIAPYLMFQRYAESMFDFSVLLCSVIIFVSMHVTHIHQLQLVQASSLSVRHRYRQLRNNFNQVKGTNCRLEHIMSATRLMAVQETQFKACEVCLMILKQDLPFIQNSDAVIALKSGSDNEFTALKQVEGQWRNTTIDSLLYKGTHVKFYIDDHGVLVLPIVWKYDVWGYILLSNCYALKIERSYHSYLEAVLQSLSLIVHQIFMFKKMAKKNELEVEVSSAQIIQDSLMPKMSIIQGLDIEATYKSANLTGGDLYGVYHNTANEVVDIFIGDVSGHGLPSAMVTALVYGSIYAMEQLLSTSISFNVDSERERITRIFNELNNQLIRLNKHHLTMSIISLNLKTGETIYLNAAHPALLWFHKQSNKVETILRPSKPLGIETPIDLGFEKFILEADDRIMFYTDGLIENHSEHKRPLNLKVIRQIFEQEKSLSEINQDVIAKANEITDNQYMMDDVTILTLEWNGIQNSKYRLVS